MLKCCSVVVPSWQCWTLHTTTYLHQCSWRVDETKRKNATFVRNIPKKKEARWRSSFRDLCHKLFLSAPIDCFANSWWYLMFFNWANLRLFLVIFVLFKRKFYRTNLRLQRYSNLDHQCKRQARWPLDHHHGPGDEKIYITSTTLVWVLSSTIILIALGFGQVISVLPHFTFIA